MTITKFKKDIKQGLITDFSPYLTKKYPETYREEMVKSGICVQEAVAFNEPLPLIAAINNGYEKDQYQDWAYHQSIRVRETLSKNGYFPSKFVNDEELAVRTAVCYQYPELAKKLLTRTIDYLHIWAIVKETQYPRLELLDIFIKTPIPQGIDGVDLNPIRQKLNAMKHEPSILEESMSIQQLYLSDNQLWFRDIPIYRRNRIDELSDEYGKDIVACHIDKLVYPITYHDAVHELRYNFDVLPGLKTQDSRLPNGKRAQFSSLTHS